MTTKEIIRCHAGSQPEQRFTRKGLISWMQEVGLFRDGSEAALNLSLTGMQKSGEFRFARGAELYTIFENLLSSFDVSDKTL